MKFTFLHCLLMAAPIVGYSQQPAKDPAKEQNDLIALRTQLTQQSASLKTEIDQEQALLDATTQKIATYSAELVKIKAEDPEGHKSYIKNNEKKVQHYREQVAQQNKQLNTQRAQLKEAADLIKDLDDQIGKLPK